MLPTGKITEPYVQQHEDGRWMLIAPTADPKTSWCATYCEKEDEAEELLSYWKEGFRVARARFAAAPAVSAPAWQPIETAPKDGATVLLWESGSSAPFVGAWRDGRRPGWHCDTEHYNTDGDACVVSNLWQEGVTHWMPLPAAPGFPAPGAGHGDA